MKNLIPVLGLIFLSFCTTSVATSPESIPPNHLAFNSLLKKYVDDDGLVNYQGIQTERARFQKYFALLGANAPNDGWTPDEKLAYWINAQNAFIAIYHTQSGLYTQYVHLNHKGVLVKLGDYVKKGQPIGISGMTGFTTIEHLHFNVIT